MTPLRTLTPLRLYVLKIETGEIEELANASSYQKVSLTIESGSPGTSAYRATDD